ncbi:hypothetical protein HanIR_Chr14g0678661 [Helianthus annuus]|nr:hypothetical protein HanIR_Chr14g0678661 [Helianthus annuus]
MVVASCKAPIKPHQSYKHRSYKPEHNVNFMASTNSFFFFFFHITSKKAKY